MTWLTDIMKIRTEKQLMIKFYVIKSFISLKIRNMMDINVDLLQWFIISAETVKNEVFSNTYLAEELHKTFIRNLRKEKYNHLLQIISEVQV